MKKLLIPLAFFAALFVVVGANPPYEAFLGTNGIVISSNPPTGKVIVDGRALTNGLSFGGGGLTTNANQFLGVPLSIKDAALLTNALNRGAGFLGAVTNILTAPQFLGTNVVFDGSLSSWFQFNPATGPETNYVFTNIQAGQTIRVSTFVTNGATVRLWANTSEIPAGWYIGNNGGAFNINSNAPSVVYVSRDPLIPATNVTIKTRDLELTAGANVIFNTNFPAGVVSASVNDPLVVTNIIATNIIGGGSLIGSTNFMNLSVQAAKLPNTNYAFIDGGWQAWETVYAETNAEGARVNLSAAWQFIVPPDYSNNTLKLLINYSLANTNGPNASNVVWGASLLSIRSGTTNNVHTNVFGPVVKGSNSWIAKYDGTNIVTNLVINLDSSGLQSRDLSVIKLERFPTEDTYGGAAAVHGLQLEYTRP